MKTSERFKTRWRQDRSFEKSRSNQTRKSEMNETFDLQVHFNVFGQQPHFLVHPFWRIPRFFKDGWALKPLAVNETWGPQIVRRIDLALKNCICDVITLTIDFHCDFINAPLVQPWFFYLFVSVQPSSTNFRRIMFEPNGPRPNI